MHVFVFLRMRRSWVGVASSVSIVPSSYAWYVQYASKKRF